MSAATARSLSAIGVEDLLKLSRPELNELYTNSPIGPIPVGDTIGTAIIIPGSLVGRLAAPFIRLFAWQGKVFYPAQEELLNKVSIFGLKFIRAKVYLGESWLAKGQKAIIIDYSRTSLMARSIRDEIRQVAPGLYLGKAFWGQIHVLDFCLRTN
jgi:hypothetical protein